MNFKTLIAIASVLLIASLAGTANAVVQYTVTDLGTLGGAQSYALAINAAGQVTGHSVAGDGRLHPFLYSGGVMQDLGAPPVGFSYGLGARISDSGAVVGYWDNPSITRRAFLYSGGSMQDLPLNSADGINGSGQIVGYAGSPYPHASLYSGGTVQDLGTLGDLFSAACAINDLGEVTGRATLASEQSSHAFIYTGGVMKDIHTVSSARASIGISINNSGQVAGYLYDVADKSLTSAFVYTDGVMHDLDASFGGQSSVASGINTGGQVVGYHQLPGSYPMNPLERAFLYTQAGGVQDLNNLLAPGSGWTLGRALAINDNGWIVGQGTNAAGQKHAFLLTPVPEPTCLALLSLGLVAALRRRS